MGSMATPTDWCRQVSCTQPITTLFKLYKFPHMAFGLKDAVPTFQWFRRSYLLLILKRWILFQPLAETGLHPPSCVVLGMFDSYRRFIKHTSKLEGSFFNVFSKLLLKYLQPIFWFSTREWVRNISESLGAKSKILP